MHVRDRSLAVHVTHFTPEKAEDGRSKFVSLTIKKTLCFLHTKCVRAVPKKYTIVCSVIK